MKEELLKRNLEAIIQYNPFHLDNLISQNFSEIGDGVITKMDTNGIVKVFFRQGSRELRLQSGYDSIAEAERIIGNVEPTRDYLFLVFGIGLGHHLFALKRKISPETRVVIIEPNLDVLKYALNHVDFTEIFSSGQFLLFFGDQKHINKMVTGMASLGYYKLVHNAKVIMLPNYYVYADQNKEVVKQIHKVLLNTVISFGNDLEDHFLGFANICNNTDAIMNSYSFEDFKGKYTDVPAIIVASGPSLDKNIHLLKKANGKALIITCDASMKACDKNDVQPDAIASIERVEATYKFYYKEKSFPKDLVLLAPGTVWPNVCSEYPGKMVLVSRNDNGFENIWMSSFDHFRFVNVGHSCATLAFTAAREAGCNPIILLGQDLAYTNGKAHSDLTHTYEFEGANDDRNADDVYVEDYEGNLLKSSFIFQIFKEWYEMQIANYENINVIDATEGGAYIKGTTLMTLDEAIQRYCQRPIEKHLVEFLPDKKVIHQNKLDKYETLLKTMDDDMKDLERIKKETNLHMKRLRSIDKNLKPDCSNNQLIAYVQKMKKGDNVIQRIKRSSSLESYYFPIILQTVTQVKRIGNELTSENVRRNLLLQYNLMFMIVNSTDLIIKEYLKSKEILEQKYGEFKDGR